MKKELIDFLTKVSWEGDLLYVLQNYQELVPDDVALKADAETIDKLIHSFEKRLNILCDEHGIDREEIEL